MVNVRHEKEMPLYHGCTKGLSTAWSGAILGGCVLKMLRNARTGPAVMRLARITSLLLLWIADLPQHPLPPM